MEINLSFALVLFVILDVVSGVINAFLRKELNSGIMREGLTKKVAIFCLATLSWVLSQLTEFSPIYDSVCVFYVAEEALSIIENLQDYVPIPDVLKKALGGKRDG